MGENRYQLKDRIKPFFRGLVRFRAFREVALEGLRRGVSGSLGDRYAKRIGFSDTPQDISRALSQGCSETAQEILVEAFRDRYENKVGIFNMVIEFERDVLALTSLENRRDAYSRETNSMANELLKTGKITSDKARRILEDEFARKDRYRKAMDELNKTDQMIARVRKGLKDN